MVVINEPTDNLVREMYARFGLAYYHSEVLHRGLCIILALSDLPHRDLITRPRIEERLAHAFSLTLGDVITELAGKIPAEYSTRLDKAREKRNFLAHYFWFDRSHLMFRADHIRQMIHELDGIAGLFNRLDKATSRWFRVRQHELGLTDEILQDCLTRIMSGKAAEPLPGKDVVKDREKKLARKRRLVRVWEFELPEGSKPLVFEMQDGSLWQLCDGGLGWTQFQNIGPQWIENRAIQPYLPADITPRPKDIKPWEYEFKLKGGAVLWVKPGKRPKTFRWGIRTRNRGTEQ